MNEKEKAVFEKAKGIILKYSRGIITPEEYDFQMREVWYNPDYTDLVQEEIELS